MTLLWFHCLADFKREAGITLRWTRTEAEKTRAQLIDSPQVGLEPATLRLTGLATRFFPFAADYCRLSFERLNGRVGVAN